MNEREGIIKGLKEMLLWLESYYPNLLTDDLEMAIDYLERQPESFCGGGNNVP